MKHIPYRQNPPFDFLKKLLGKRNTNLANAGMNPKALQCIMGHFTTIERDNLLRQRIFPRKRE